MIVESRRIVGGAEKYEKGVGGRIIDPVVTI